MERPSDDVNTLLDAFKRSVRNVPNNPYLGTRNEKVEGRPYEWKTWREVDEITTNLSIGKLKPHLSINYPTFYVRVKVKNILFLFRMMIYAK